MKTLIFASLILLSAQASASLSLLIEDIQTDTIQTQKDTSVRFRYSSGKTFFFRCNDYYITKTIDVSTLKTAYDPVQSESCFEAVRTIRQKLSEGEQLVSLEFRTHIDGKNEKMEILPRFL